MNKSVFFLTLPLVIIGPSGCGGVPPSQSNFKANFSLNAIVEANRGYLLEEARVSSGAESGSQEDFIQKYEEIVLRIDPVNTPAFMEAIQAGIEESLLDSGARVIRAGALRYRHDRRDRKDDIIGVANMPQMLEEVRSRFAIAAANLGTDA